MSVADPSTADQTRALSKACACDDCGSKIAKLGAFEKEIKAKRELILFQQHLVQVDNKEELCLVIYSSAWWTKQMLDIFHKKLKALDISEKSGVPLRLEKSSSADNLGVVDLKIHQMLIDSGMLVKPAEKVLDDDDDDEYDDYVLNEIDTGRFYYGKTKAKDTAYCLLEKIENIEKDHDNDKKTVEAQNKMLEPSISKKYIENQVELVKKLPVQELLLEVEELIDEVQSIETHRRMFGEARDYINHICFAMVTKRKEFWKGSPKGNEHISNGVNQTLDSLLAKVTSFEDEWKQVYATFFTPRDRGNPKRFSGFQASDGLSHAGLLRGV